MNEPDIRITPEPSEEDREAILRAVRELLRAEERRARPPMWTVAGWTYRRTGVMDLRKAAGELRAWTLSARLPWGGREYPGLIGRGDAK